MQSRFAHNCLPLLAVIPVSLLLFSETPPAPYPPAVCLTSWRAGHYRLACEYEETKEITQWTKAKSFSEASSSKLMAQNATNDRSDSHNDRAGGRA